MADDFLIKIVVITVSIFVIIYILSNFGSLVEGMESNSSSDNIEIKKVPDGIAGNASTYGSNIKAQTIRLQDTLLVNKYRADYETIIMNMDDLVNNLMLQTVLTINNSKPAEGLQRLVQLHLSKAALNSVMKFIDST